jgi:hypothetical protein
MNLIHTSSKKRYELQKSRADDGDFCDMFCTTSPRLSSIESVVFQPLIIIRKVHRSTQPHGPVREIKGAAGSLIYRVVGPLDSQKGLAARLRFALAS